MTNSPLTQQALNKAMMEAVDFIHAEGWDAAPTLFALGNLWMVRKELMKMTPEVRP